MKKFSAFNLSRREVLAAGSALAATAGITNAAYAGAGGCFGHQRTAQLSVAYLQGSETWDYLHGLTPDLGAVTEDMTVDEAPLIAAESIASGDVSFAVRGARIAIHGLVAKPTAGLPAMHLKAHYQPYHEGTHVAWGFEGSELCCAQPATAFTMPVEAGTGLRLSLEVRPRGSQAEDGEAAVAETKLGLGVLPGGAKLRRGAYLMAWGLPDGPLLPPWSRYRVVAEQIEAPGEGLRASRRFMVQDASGAATTLQAVLLTVDYGDSVSA